DILAAQGELEAATAIEVAMTDSLVAAGARQDGHDLVAETDRLCVGRCSCCQHQGDRHRDSVNGVRHGRHNARTGGTENLMVAYRIPQRRHSETRSQRPRRYPSEVI